MSEAIELYALRRIYDGIREDSTFQTFEDFFDWAEGKYRSGHTIYKLDQTKPYSPENSYWYYAQWFVQNWNENICIKPKVMNGEAFRYEHPDLEREGLCFISEI